MGRDLPSTKDRRGSNLCCALLCPTLQRTRTFPDWGLCVLFCNRDFKLRDTGVLLALIVWLPPGAGEPSSSSWTNARSLLERGWASPSTEWLLFARIEAEHLLNTVFISSHKVLPGRVPMTPFPYAGLRLRQRPRVPRLMFQPGWSHSGTKLQPHSPAARLWARCLSLPVCKMGMTE